MGGKQNGTCYLAVVTYLKALHQNLPSEIKKTQETSVRLSLNQSGFDSVLLEQESLKLLLAHMLGYLHFTQLLSHMTDFNLCNRYKIVKL